MKLRCREHEVVEKAGECILRPRLHSEFDDGAASQDFGHFEAVVGEAADMDITRG